MKFTSAFIAAILSTVAIAAPAPNAEPVESLAERQSGVVSMMAAAPQWTIQSMKRVCASGTCTWTFSINNHVAPATACTFKVKGNPASQTDSTGNVCGVYTVSTGWSGQFGPGKGFTTLAVVNNAKKQIVYPSYTDKQLNTGKVVTPDQSYAPQNLPS